MMEREWTIREIIDKVNEKVQTLVGKKMDANEFHSEVDRLSRMFLKPNGMEYAIWKIHFKGDKIAELKIERKDDKRYKWAVSMWRVLSINFEVTDKSILDMTIAEVVRHNEKCNVEQCISSIDTSIEEMYKKIDKMKADRQQYVERLAKI